MCDFMCKWKYSAFSIESTLDKNSLNVKFEMEKSQETKRIYVLQREISNLNAIKPYENASGSEILFKRKEFTIFNDCV